MDCKESCPRCLIKVESVDKGIQCDVCQRWFHADCIGMASAEYKRYANNVSLAWQCNRVDCSNSGQSVTLELLLHKIEALATRDDVQSLRSEIVNLSDKISSIEPRLIKVEDDIDNLKHEIAGIKTSFKEDGTTSANEVFTEIFDRTQRQANIIVYKASESTLRGAAANKEHDLRLLNTIFESINFKPSSFSFFRLGKPTSSKQRPIKVILPNSESVREFFKLFSTDKLAGSIVSCVTASRDRTLQERKHLEDLRKSLDSRIALGEKDLTIKYMNGIPKITKQSKN